ncbi:hypothetical protein GCM10008957_33060 [Deinococcus ruber]|uniref:Uncharacterized protein n=1 Tax=Deinococcus ruber TaxID=1848197 RepID=A0A918CDX4_9DEIO|nr:hypothetical protein GCM10008957_33060 [Deinococcus ruber]
MFPGGAVETQQPFPWWKVHEDERQEDLHDELFVPDAAFYPAFFSFYTAVPWRMRRNLKVIDLLG